MVSQHLGIPGIVQISVIFRVAGNLVPYSGSLKSTFGANDSSVGAQNQKCCVCFGFTGSVLQVSACKKIMITSNSA